MLLGWMMKTYNITIVTRHSGRKELRTTPIGEATVYKRTLTIRRGTDKIYGISQPN